MWIEFVFFFSRVFSLQLASLVSLSLKRNNNKPYASSWLERLRSIKRLRKRILEGNSSQTRINQMDDFTVYTQ